MFQTNERVEGEEGEGGGRGRVETEGEVVRRGFLRIRRRWLRLEPPVR